MDVPKIIFIFHNSINIYHEDLVAAGVAEENKGPMGEQKTITFVKHRYNLLRNIDIK